eukprot:1158263-Pelagomonas_calceolata.AAC.1
MQAAVQELTFLQVLVSKCYCEFLCPAGYSVFLTSLNDDDDGELLDSALKARVSDRMDAGH